MLLCFTYAFEGDFIVFVMHKNAIGLGLIMWLMKSKREKMFVGESRLILFGEIFKQSVLRRYGKITLKSVHRPPIYPIALCFTAFCSCI